MRNAIRRLYLVSLAIILIGVVLILSDTLAGQVGPLLYTGLGLDAGGVALLLLSLWARA